MDKQCKYKWEDLSRIKLYAKCYHMYVVCYTTGLKQLSSYFCVEIFIA